MRSFRKMKLTCLAATMAVSAGTASAALLAYEGFDVTAGDLDGQATVPSGSFYAGTESWSVEDDSTVDGYLGQTGGLNYAKNGNALTVNAGNVQSFRNSTFNDGSGATARLRPSSTTSSTTFTETYFSALIDADSLVDANQVQIAWDHNSKTSGNELRVHGFEVRGSGDIFSFAAGVTDTDTGLDLAAGVNLLVVRVTEKTLGSNNTDEYDLWLNPDPSNLGIADFSAADGFNDGLVVNNSDFGFDGFWINAAYNGNGGSQQSVLIDELRLGTLASDVLPFTSEDDGEDVTPAVPEPATMMLAALGGAALLRRRR